VVGYFIQVFY